MISIIGGGGLMSWPMENFRGNFACDAFVSSRSQRTCHGIQVGDGMCMMDNVWSVQEILNGAVGGNYAFCSIEHENYKGLL